LAQFFPIHPACDVQYWLKLAALHLVLASVKPAHFVSVADCEDDDVLAFAVQQSLAQLVAIHF
jgi:hypothetical protein